jgi:hypothetical protein
VKNHDFTPKIIFFPILGGRARRVRCPLDPPLYYIEQPDPNLKSWIRPCNTQGNTHMTNGGSHNYNNEAIGVNTYIYIIEQHTCIVFIWGQ